MGMLPVISKREDERVKGSEQDVLASHTEAIVSRGGR